MDEKLIDPKPEKLEVEQSNKMQRRISFGIEEKEKERRNEKRKEKKKWQSQ